MIQSGEISESTTDGKAVHIPGSAINASFVTSGDKRAVFIRCKPVVTRSKIMIQYFALLMILKSRALLVLTVSCLSL